MIKESLKKIEKWRSHYPLLLGIIQTLQKAFLPLLSFFQGENVTTCQQMFDHFINYSIFIKLIYIQIYND